MGPPSSQATSGGSAGPEDRQAGAQGGELIDSSQKIRKIRKNRKIRNRDARYARRLRIFGDFWIYTLTCFTGSPRVTACVRWQRPHHRSAPPQVLRRSQPAGPCAAARLLTYQRMTVWPAKTRNPKPTLTAPSIISPAWPAALVRPRVPPYARGRSETLDAATAAAHQAAPWLLTLARVGYVAKGVLYLAMAALALRLAQGQPAASPEPQAALGWLGNGPWGDLLLGVAAIGSLGYAAWKLAAALAGAHRKPTRRLGAAATGFAHLGLGLAAGSRLLGRPMGGGGGSARRRVVAHLGAAGFAARGVGLGLAGWFIVQAALQAAPQRARGFGGAIAGLLAWPEGRALLAIVALAFAAYGLFRFVKARSPRLDPLAAGG